MSESMAFDYVVEGLLVSVEEVIAWMALKSESTNGY